MTERKRSQELAQRLVAWRQVTSAADAAQPDLEQVELGQLAERLTKIDLSRQSRNRQRLRARLLSKAGQSRGLAWPSLLRQVPYVRRPLIALVSSTMVLLLASVLSITPWQLGVDLQQPPLEQLAPPPSAMTQQPVVTAPLAQRIETEFVLLPRSARDWRVVTPATPSITFAALPAPAPTPIPVPAPAN
jgi:hypothetical protein